MTKKIRYIIVCDGTFPSREPLEAFFDCDGIICCDAAVSSVSRHFDPDFIVGDLDSISKKHREKYASKLIYDPDQETNDLTKAVKFTIDKILIPGHDYEIIIIGATGKREDHSIGNISLLPQYTRALYDKVGKGSSIKMMSDYGTFSALFDTTVFECPVGSAISLFSFDPTLVICSQGLEYPTDKVVFDYWWKATLNRSSAPQFTLTFSHPAPVLIYVAYQRSQHK